MARLGPPVRSPGPGGSSLRLPPCLPGHSCRTAYHGLRSPDPSGQATAPQPQGGYHIRAQGGKHSLSQDSVSFFKLGLWLLFWGPLSGPYSPQRTVEEGADSEDPFQPTASIFLTLETQFSPGLPCPIAQWGPKAGVNLQSSLRGGL